MKHNIFRPGPAELLHIRRETAIDWTFRLRWNTPPAPGQFYQVSVPRVGEAPFSASGWGEGWIDLTIRNVGRVTAALFGMQPGERLFVRGPYGRPFPVDAFAGTHTVIAAGGTGLAPVRGLIRELLARRGGPDGPVRLDLLLGFRTPADILFREDIAAWTEQTGVALTVDRAGEDWNGRVGVITTLIPDLALLSETPRRIVVVGPPLMMKYTVGAFLERGVDEDDILVSYERHMSCGIGKCGHCKINDTYVCVDGPVFSYADAQWLMD